ncbi:pentatricopeptide repeat-containing protein At3g12770-like [Rutidosis leptorrhynchoides]|uniref:pentatricopeptide repeat-containing protein At3g12770-like n=1 Tax=Rutidosis leptorrhynchoides TaxID=125765 RepID=UPI003A99AC28
MFSTNPLQSPAISHLNLLKLSITNQSLKLAQQTHAQLYCLGLHQNPIISTNLINAYSVFKYPVLIRKVFDSIDFKDCRLWNTLINYFQKNDLCNESFSLFNEMCWTGDCVPDEFTFSTLAKASGVIGDLSVGKWVHGKCIKLGFCYDTVLVNSLLSMYKKCDGFQECRQLFDEMPQRTVSSWNVMISGYLDGKMSLTHYQVWEFIKNMLNEGLTPNEFTLSNLLPTCGNTLGQFDYGRELHCYIIRHEMNIHVDSGVHLDCCLIDMYSRCGKLYVARLIFDRTRFKNVFVWTAMMNGYLKDNDPKQTLILFRSMLKSNVEFNEVSLLTVLQACSLVAGLLGVKQIHVLCVKMGFVNHSVLCNVLIDMYSKNGLLSYAKQVFDHNCISKDAISWSCMISGYALHGKGQKAVDLYEKMLENGIKSDAINVVSVLSACSRSGLVEKGLDIYNKAISVHGINPTVEMCSCVVDLLGRAGQLDKALNFIKMMPLDPGPSVWGALVSASIVHTDDKTSVLGYKSLIEIEPENASNYVLLSNLYAMFKKWDCVADVRKVMKDRSLNKQPGCSWIDVNTKTHSFFVCDKTHPASDEIYKILNELILVMKRPCSGYITGHDFN